MYHGTQTKAETSMNHSTPGNAYPFLALAVAAGEAIREVVKRGATEATAKADGSPVTAADAAAEAVILAGLRRLQPGEAVLSEEAANQGADPAAAARYWCVDPLDGTKEFIRGGTDFTVNIALVEDGRPTFGVVYAPARDCLWWGVTGQGAWRVDTAAAVLASGADMPTSACASLPMRRPGTAEPLTAMVSRSHCTPETHAFLARHGITHTSDLGSSLKICAVAEGTADVYPRLGPTCYWDSAAGCAVARAAGCRIVCPDGADLNYGPGVPGWKHPAFIVYRPERFTLLKAV